MKKIDAVALWGAIAAAAWALFAAKTRNPWLAALLTLLFLCCLRRACARLKPGTRVRARRKALEEARRYVAAISLADADAASEAIRAFIEAEYGLRDHVAVNGGFLYRAEGPEGAAFLLSPLPCHPDAGRVGAKEAAEAYRAMRAAGAARAAVVATCPAGKPASGGPLDAIRVLDGERLARIIARHPELIDPSRMPEQTNSARGAKLRALGKALLIAPTPRQCALCIGYAALMLLAYAASRSPIALLCLSVQLLRAICGLSAWRKPAPPRLL